MRNKKFLAVALAAAMLTAASAVTVSATNDSEEDNSTYVLMNIPYSEFYQAELNNDVAVDVYTSATKSKTRAGNLAAGSYHTDNSGDEITGVTFPVKLVGDVDLSAYQQVKDDAALEITVSMRGKETTTVYNGQETLFENPSYAYYVLDNAPKFYKEVTQNADGSLNFGTVRGYTEEISADVDLTKDSKYGDYQMNITSDALTSTEDKTITVYGVVLSTEEGNDYGLRCMENIWRNTALAWCTGYTQNVHGSPTSSAHYEAMAGQTINKVTYYTGDGIKTISGLSLYVDPEKYALMNIPYSDFYASELENDTPVDVFTSATKAKTKTGTLAGGSYHAVDDGSEITGITYPVKLGDIDLSGYRRITDSDSYEVTVTNRGQTSTDVYEGKDALFGSDSYSYYILDEMPSYYKTVSDNGDGTLYFSKDNTAAEEIEAEAELTTESKYGDYQLNITSDALTSNDDRTVTVYGVTLETAEGESYGLRHLENIWRNTSLAWSTGFTNEVHGCLTSSAHYEDMMGQTITKVTYFTNEGKKTFETEIYVPVKTGAKATAENAAVADGQTTFAAEGFADDFDYSYVVTNSYDEAVDVVVSDNTITYPTDIENGKYTLTITDAQGKYASVLTSFELTVPAPAQFNGKSITEEPALIAAEGADENSFADYLESIASVTVNERTFNASGKGAVRLIDAETGLLDISNTDAFSDDIEEFEITVTATGYDPISFTLSRIAAETDPEPSEPSEPSEEPSSDHSDEPSEPSTEPSDEPSDSETSEEPSETSTDKTTDPSEVSADKESSVAPQPVVNPGADVPKTADSTAAGLTLATLTASVGAILLSKRKKKN